MYVFIFLDSNCRRKMTEKKPNIDSVTICHLTSQYPFTKIYKLNKN